MFTYQQTQASSVKPIGMALHACFFVSRTSFSGCVHHHARLVAGLRSLVVPFRIRTPIPLGVLGALGGSFPPDSYPQITHYTDSTDFRLRSLAFTCGSFPPDLRPFAFIGGFIPPVRVYGYC